MNETQKRNRMNKKLVASKSIEINAESKKVWEVLTNPEKIKVYLFGTEIISDWKVGSSILFQGEFNGQKYKDKGNVLESEENKLLKYNYWSGFSGLEDLPENYSIVSYLIEDIDKDKVNFSWIQKGFSSEDGKCHTEQALETMLQQIKKLAEE